MFTFKECLSSLTASSLRSSTLNMMGAVLILGSLVLASLGEPKNYIIQVEDAEDARDNETRKQVGDDYNTEFKFKMMGCFPGSSQVKLATGDSLAMADLKTGDSIMTIVDGELTSTEVLGFLFKKHGSGAYLTIHTEDGGKVSISGTHVMFVNNYEDVMAENVNIGDMVIIKDGNNVTKSRVVKIEAEEQEGAYVPLTEQGTLLVDGVLCSSFANVPHDIAQFLAAPLRWFPSVLLGDGEGERIITTAAKHAGYYLHKIGLLNYYHSYTLQKDENSLEKKEHVAGPSLGGSYCLVESK